VATEPTRPESEPRRSPRPDPARTGQLRGYPQALFILVAAEQGELLAALQRLSLVLWGVGLILLAATALVVTIVSRRGLAPLQSVADQASRIDASKLDARFPAADLPAELESICLRLNDLLSRLEDSFARERCFSADVAHELRTPIAELRSLAEVALKWPSGDPTVVSAFEDALAIAVQMQGIVTGLLGIARCEAGTQVIAREPVAVAELVRSVWQPFEARANAKGLRVRMELPELGPIETDRAMLGVVLTNLLSNAVEYTPPGGAIEFRLQSDGPSLDFLVANSIENITVADVPRFFDRFWRKDTARSSSEHSGIGLAVSRAYARALGLHLRASLPAADWLSMQLSARM
jgi:two-component system sensor histidine kinase QseC